MKKKYRSIFDLIFPFSILKKRYRINLHIEKQIKDENNKAISVSDKAIVSIFLLLIGTSLTSGFLFFLYIIKSLLGFDLFASHVL